MERAKLLQQEPDPDRLWSHSEVKELTSWDTKTLNKRLRLLDIEIVRLPHDLRLKLIKEEDVRWMIAVILFSNAWDWAWQGFWDGTKRRRGTEEDVWTNNLDMMTMNLSQLASMERSRKYYKKSLRTEVLPGNS